MIRIKSPEQAVYDYFYSFALKQGWSTYDHLPMQNEKAKYPFVIIGDVQGVPSATKTSLNGNVIVTVDVWGDKEARSVVSDMIERFFRAAIGGHVAGNYRIFGNAVDQTKALIQDQTVPDTVLNHGIATLYVKIL